MSMFGIDIDQIVKELRDSIKVLHDLLLECKQINTNLKELIKLHKDKEKTQEIKEHYKNKGMKNR